MLGIARRGGAHVPPSGSSVPPPARVAAPPSGKHHNPSFISCSTETYSRRERVPWVLVRRGCLTCVLR